MASLTCIIEPDEFLGLRALVGLDRAADRSDTNAGAEIGVSAVSKAKVLMHRAGGQAGRSRPALGSVGRSSHEVRRRYGGAA